MTLQDILCGAVKGGRESTSPPAVHPMALPWWVVLVSSKPNPDGSPRVKFDFGFETREEAETRRQERQDAEKRRAAELSLRKMQDAENRGIDLAQIVPYTPLQFFVIERPAGGKL